MIDLTQDALRIIETTVPIAVYMMANKRKAKRENEERYEAAKKENDRRHNENKERLDALITEQQYLRPHDHSERDGPLQFDGIIWKRNGRR